MASLSSPGLVVLLGSGETLPFSGKIHEFVAQRLPKHGNVAILETPAGFEPNCDQVAGKIKSYLEQRLQNNDIIEIGDVRLRFVIPEELAEDLQDTQMFRTQIPARS